MSRRISNSGRLNEWGVVVPLPDGGYSIVEPDHLWLIPAMELAVDPHTLPLPSGRHQSKKRRKADQPNASQPMLMEVRDDAA